MIRWFAGHPTAANILMLLFLYLGLSSLPGIKRETFPDMDLFEVEVRVPYPGATAQDVEEAICARLEDATDGISFIDERRCEAREHLGLMVLKMQEAGDISQFIDDINTEIDAIDDFPEQSETAIVRELGRTTEVVTVALSADIPRPQLKDLAEDLKRQLQQLPEISLVQMEGFSDRRLRISLHSETLGRYGLSVDQIADRITQQGIDLPAGLVTTKEREYQLRVNDERRSIEELRQLIIHRGEGGGELRLGDIAQIEDRFELDERKVLFDGKPAALLKILKNKEDDSLDALHAVQSFIEQQRQRLPEQVTLTTTQDNASLISQRLGMIIKNGWQGLIIVFLSLLLFFNWRYSFWVVAGLPVSFLGGLWIMAMTGQSINMLSMMGLLLAIGLLMDDAIVISESIAQHLKKGASPVKAAVKGSQLVLRGVLSSFVSTVLILQGMLTMKGQLGQFLNDVPSVLLMVMSISLLEAFLILPHHLATSLKEEAQKKPQWRQRFETWFENRQKSATRLAERCVEQRYLFIGGLLGVFFLTIALPASGWLKFSGLPDLDGDVLQARLIMPPGTPLSRTEEVVGDLLRGLEKTNQVLGADEAEPLIQHVSVAFGKNADAFEEGPHLATISVDILTSEERSSTLDDISQHWREAVGEPKGVVAMQFKEPVIGPQGRPLFIRLYGEDLDQLSRASLELRQWLSSYEGVSDVLDDLRPGRPQLDIQLKEGALDLGIDSGTIARQLRAAFHGITAYEIQSGRESFDIEVKLEDNSRSSLSDFDQFLIIAPNDGDAIPLANIATISESRDYSRIHRVDGRRAVSIIGDVNIQQANVTQVVSDTLENFMPQLLADYPGISYSLEGEMKNIATTGQSMVSGFVAGLLGIYLLLSLQFGNYREPLIVLLTIPMALVGVIWGHVLMGYDLSMPSMIGFLSLAGVVVNDSILLVEFVRLHAKDGLSVHEAAVAASKDRFRAVVLTSVTTIAGVVPLLLETSLQAQIIKPVVISIAFGMLASTVLVLLVIPAAYGILEDLGLFKAEIEHHK